MHTKLVLGLALCAATAGATAQSVTDIKARTDDSAYLQDARGNVARTQFGLCWRTGDWAPDDAVPGCDGPLVPPVAKPTAPAIQAAPVPAPAVPPAPPPVAAAPRRCDSDITLTNDESFGFNRTVLGAAARERIDTEVMRKLAACDKVDAVVVTGHSDRLGSPSYNKKLSERRAGSVAAYLKSKGVAAPIQTVGMGSAQPVQTCNGRLPRKELINCLAPNRRIVINIRGNAK